MTNRLYYGDNLDILRKEIKDESVDLIYLDPPFNSKRDYNLLFKTPKGQESDAQIMAFEDTWHWGPRAVSGHGYSNLGGPSQICEITRKVAPLQEWGNVRLGFLRDKPIRRRNIICYVANKLGGVHFDSLRFPRHKADKAEFKVLAQVYDWDKQAVMHAGLVAVALACVEMIRMPVIQDLLAALERFHAKRQKRLREGLPLS